MKELEKRKIVLGISGGIAAYKSAYLTRLLVKAGAEVTVIMTANAQKFITPLTFQTLSGRRVISSAFDPPAEVKVEHIELAHWAEILVVAPATANIMAKFAHGIADDFLSTFYLSLGSEKPVLLAPAMNYRMWLHPATQSNLKILKDRGTFIVGPGVGDLACLPEEEFDSDKKALIGRMSEPDEIYEALQDIIKPKKKDLEGIKVLITAGPTREAIDAVRFISNPSSGKMGYAMAKAAIARGAEVILISGPTNLYPPAGLKSFHSVQSAEEMYQAVHKEFPTCQVLIKAAAVGDYRAVEYSAGKLKKDQLGENWNLELVRTKDILAEVTKNKKDQIVVGFAAEFGDVSKAEAKIFKKNLDLLVVNDVSDKEIGFGSDYNKVSLIFADGRKKDLLKMSKVELSDVILDEIIKILNL